MACGGRDPKFKISHDGETVSVQDWALEILENMQGVTELLDTKHGPDYSVALQAQIEKVRDCALLPSSRVMQVMEKYDGSFFGFALASSRKHKKYFSRRSLPEQRFQRFEEMAIQSINEQEAIESTDTLSLGQYLANYFR